MTDYKATLNLPKTDFPMKANLAQREPTILDRWQQMDLHNTLVKRHADRPKFIFHDGPPYANGKLHVGHALNKILKDIVCKSKILAGYNAPFIPGWDCHGLPIEINVEKKVGKVGDKIDAAGFHLAARKYANGQIDGQREEFIRMGVLADWQNPYLTMSSQYEADIVRTMASIIERGHLQKGEKPVHWCPLCSSALAEAEVEYKDKTSPAIDVAFMAVDKPSMAAVWGIDGGELESIIVPIWTTTPWTLPANQAVAVNPELDYVLVQAGHTGYVLVKELAEQAMTRYGIEEHKILATVKGEVLEKQMLQHPFLDRQVPIILGAHVTTDAGTGNVHTAPAHGQDDFVVGQEYCLPVDNPVNAKSCFVEGMPHVAGQHVYKANDPIIEVLKNHGSLIYLTSLEHSYPHCWRHKSPLIFRATPQWFISMDKNKLRQQALDSIKQVQWIPAWGENRITKMIADRPDWCVSRQRSWGTPIALFIHKDTGEAHPDTVALMRRVADAIEEKGIEAWGEVDINEYLGDDAEDYVKSSDTLDVWFDSGSSHRAVLEHHPELHTPADLYLEGSDQHRGWFHSSLLTSTAIHGHAPYKAVLTHGYLVDGDGRKMSKSIGNIVSPGDVIKKVGGDVLRLWAASTDYQNDVRFSDEIIKRATDAYRRIRNTARFLLSNLSDFNPATDMVAVEDMVELDRWAVCYTAAVQKKILDAYDNYQFHNIYQMIHNFCAVEMGSFYLDIIKDRQYTCKGDGIARRSAQTAMVHIIEAMVRWLAPILSFTAEEIWACMPGERDDTIFYSQYYQDLQNTGVDLERWQLLMQVRDEVNKVLEAHRNQGEIKSALDAGVTLYASGDLLKTLQGLGDELRFLLITSDAKVAEGSEGAATDIEGLSVKVEVLSAEKCERCWQRRDDVGSIAGHETICSRCVENIDGAGEVRQFA
ncbi:MAG: isoleucine--tRNA ligase [Coxiellaceae bacterium]|nr:isoleucine--tRNA ligase [Coxiellaceae bacterium]